MSVDLKHMFTERIGLKIASVFLSLVVFTHVYTEQEREWTFRVPLETANLTEALCFVTPPPPDVLVKVRGKGKDLIKLKLRGARAVIDLGDPKPGTLKRILSSSDILIPADLDVTVADVIEPKVLSLELDSRLAKLIRVVPVYSGSLAPGLELSGPPKVEPEQVQATGARKILAAVDYINTIPIDIGGMTAPSTVDAALDVGTLNLSLEPGAVQVTFPVEKVGIDTGGSDDADRSSVEGG